MNLSVSDITRHLDTAAVAADMFDIEIFDSLDSTNVTLKKMAAANALEGKLIIAESQSAGHGRFDRPFFSPAGTGIYMSLLLKPDMLPTDVPLITTCAAVAISAALDEAIGCSSKIKWINDIFINNKKVCGILTEASFNAADAPPEYVILGVGVNVFEPEGGFPKELAGIAASAILSHGSDDHTYRNFIRGKIIAGFLKNLMRYYPNLEKREFLEEYRMRSLVLGKEIRIMDNACGTAAKAVAIDDNCNLIAELHDKSIRTLNSGEISIRL